MSNKIARTDRFLAREPECPVVTRLKDRGFLRVLLGNWVELSCPQCGERAYYVLPSESTPMVGVYACACGMTTASLLAFLKISEFDADWRDKLVLQAGEFRYAVLTMEKRLAETGRFFRFCGQLVEIFDRGRDVEMLFFTKDSLPMVVASCLSLYRVDRRMAGELKLRPTDLPDRYGRALLSNLGKSELPALRGVVECPLLMPDGRLKAGRGYDPDSRFWLNVNPQAFEGTVERVSREDAQKAYGRLQKVLAGVSFARESDEVAAIASILCAVLKPSVQKCPLIHIFASSPGAGKSSLTKALSLLPTRAGRATYLSFPSSEEEMQRLLASVLRNAPKVVAFDNLKGDLVPYGALCTSLTEGHFSARVLGSNSLIDIGNEAIFISNGNGVLPRQDMVRRTLLIKLSAQPFRAIDRSQTIEDLFTRRRIAIMTDALIIVRAWITSGKSTFDAFPSFPDWDSQCRFPLLWLGKPDPLQRTFELLKKGDSEDELCEVIQLLKSRFQKATFRVADIDGWFKKVSGDDESQKRLKLIFEEWGLMNGEKVNARKVGRKLVRMAETARVGTCLEIVERKSPVSFRVVYRS